MSCGQAWRPAWCCRGKEQGRDISATHRGSTGVGGRCSYLVVVSLLLLMMPSTLTVWRRSCSSAVKFSGHHPLLPLERPSLLPGAYLNMDEMEKCCFMSVASTIAITVLRKSALTYGAAQGTRQVARWVRVTGEARPAAVDPTLCVHTFGDVYLKKLYSSLSISLKAAAYNSTRQQISASGFIRGMRRNAHAWDASGS